jgi:uncharacterized heparinase superfamily protein
VNELFFEVEQRRDWGMAFRELFPQAADQALADADRWIDSHVITRKGQVIDLGTPIDWLYNPTGDKEFTWTLNRFKHLRCLGIAYAMTGNELYAAKALEHVLGWIETQPSPYGQLPAEELTYFQRPGPWRLLETGLRLRQWVHAYHFFRDSASWNEAAEARFLESVKEHAEFLSTYTASIEINHSIMHMIGLLSAALTFDSWPESARWRELAVDRLEQCIREQVLADGVHSELTPHYHMVSLELFVDCAVMLGKRGYSFSAEYERILAGMVQFSRCMTRQDGKMAPFADSYATNPPDLNAAALYYDEPEWVLMAELHEQFWMAGPERIKRLLDAYASKRTELGGAATESLPAAFSYGDHYKHGGATAEPLPFAFPHGGYYGLGDAAQKLIFDAAALGGPHGHADALSFELCAFGEALFVDPGTYTYMENPWRKYFKSTAAHNTVLVDGQDQTPYLRTQRWGLTEAAVSLIAWDPQQQMICAEHDGYAGRGVIHRRALWFLESGEWVIYDRLTAGSGAAMSGGARGGASADTRVSSGASAYAGASAGAVANAGGNAGANAESAVSAGMDADTGVSVGANTRAGVSTLSHTYQHRLHSTLLDWKLDKLEAGPVGVKLLATGSGHVSGERPELGCDMLLFGPAALELDVEDSWESLVSMTMRPLKVVQGLVTSEEDAWFITVLKPKVDDAGLEPAEWSVSNDENGVPVLSRNCAGEIKRYMM